MAESMSGMKRTHRCAELSKAQVGQTVTVMGWVQKSRNKGGVVFVDLRDRSGILQIIFEEISVVLRSLKRQASSEVSLLSLLQVRYVNVPVLGIRILQQARSRLLQSS